MKFLIDTNILIDWVLLKHLFKKNDKRIEKFKSSLEFINKAVKDKNNEFYTTYFNIGELPNAISKKFVLLKMFLDDTPLNYYASLSKDLRKQFSSDIKFAYGEILKTLVLNGKIVPKNIDLDVDKIKEINNMQIKYGLDLYDAIIFKIFTDERMNCFVTRDTDFLENKELKKEHRGKIKHPEEAKKLI